MGPVRTLIDYVFVRTKDADSIAKGCLPVTTFPIADWRLDGRHRVLIASLAVSWKVRTGQKPKPAYDREAMLADYKRDPLLTEVSHAFQSLMQENCKGAEEISSCLLQACCQVYPVAMAPPPADRMQLVRGPIATMWATWREMRAVRGATLRSIILTWKLRVRFKAQKRIVDGWMVLAPKAGKPLCRACDVRPLALQDPGGKAAIRTVKEAIQPFVDEYMKTIPQYAYLQNRDGQMAILRLTLSLDLRMAFDVLPRLLVESEAFTLTPTRGIRQGCVLSPLIWTCVTGTMVRDLAALDIAVTDLDLYADDYLHQELLTTYEAFAPALTKLGVIIQYLQEQGLQVSLDKTVVLCRLAGTRASMAMKQHTFKRKDREGLGKDVMTDDMINQEQEEGLMELLKATARLAIRLEDQQSLDRLDKAFLLHQRTQVPECMLEEMFKISETWKEAKASSYMLEFQSRLRKIEHAEVVQGLVEQGWLFKQGEDLTW
ncbi:unnamed protein product, partial [Symbiodinium sp. KB8]